MRYITQEQMKIIDLVKGEVEQHLIGDDYMRKSMASIPPAKEYYDGRYWASWSLMRFLNGFEVKGASE